ncbi:hypothetical protein TSUD_195180 [Trifolium subterraneum]|nr:hypothetical protein TSUD_195180 [Trifolium subterraneum]
MMIISKSTIYNNATIQSWIKFGHGRKNVTSLERIEEGLAQARSMIHEAIRSKKYTITMKQSFVTKGSIYLNPHAFHQ